MTLPSRRRIVAVSTTGEAVEVAVEDSGASVEVAVTVDGMAVAGTTMTTTEVVGMVVADGTITTGTEEDRAVVVDSVVGAATTGTGHQTVAGTDSSPVRRAVSVPIAGEDVTVVASVAMTVEVAAMPEESAMIVMATMAAGTEDVTVDGMEDVTEVGEDAMVVDRTLILSQRLVSILKEDWWCNRFTNCDPLPPFQTTRAVPS